MFEIEYGEAAVEVLDILDNTNKTEGEKIPKSFIKFLVEIASTDYKVNFDHSKPISELNIKEKTREILGTIYINWWSDGESQRQYKKQVEEYEKKKQEEIREKYNPDKIFENRKRQQENEKIEEIGMQNEAVAMVKYKENRLKRIIQKILNFFKK